MQSIESKRMVRPHNSEARGDEKPPDANILPNVSMPPAEPLFVDEPLELKFDEVAKDPTLGKLIAHQIRSLERQVQGYEITRTELSKVREQNAVLREQARYSLLKDFALLFVGALLGFMPSINDKFSTLGVVIAGIMCIGLLVIIVAQGYLGKKN